MSEPQPTPAPAQRKSGNTTRLILIAGVMALVAAFFVFDLGRYLSLDLLKANRAALQQWTSAHPVAAIGGFVAIYVAMAALSVPGAVVLTLAGGALFGVLIGTIAVSFASSIGATLAFLASRYVLRDAVRRRFGARLKPIEDGVKRDGAFYLLSLRLVPLFPFVLVNVLMGLTPMRTGLYYVVSQLGMLPATIAYVYAGSQLAQLNSVRDVASPGLIAALVVLGILPLAMRKLSDVLVARRVYRGHRKPHRFDYNLIVIGAGSAGLVSAYIGAAVKAKVALIEKHRLGGDCLNTGCVPSKALLRSARLLAEARNSGRYGIASMQATFDFAQVMERVHEVIAKIEPHDSKERYTSLGVDVIQGNARLVSPWEVLVDGRRLSARSVILASGASPLVPPIPGLDGVPYLTSDTLWGLRVLPKRLLILGGGPIGCELAQAFARFGSEVTVVEMAPRLLPREDADAATEIAKVFESEGIRLAMGHKALRVDSSGDGGTLVCEHGDSQVTIAFDTLLLALGRKANVTGYGLEALGVRLRDNGTIAADALLRTNFPNIYACGDATGPFQFTHVAAHQAWYAAVNGLLAPWWSYKVDYRVIPWCTFTEPEVARVGLSEDEAKAQGIAVEVTRYGIDDLDRAIAESADHGYVKVLTKPGSDRILGATIVGVQAGELIAEFVLAMKYNLGMNKILGTIHTYPTLMEANKYAAGGWKRAHAPQAALRFAQRFFSWRRG